MISTTDNETMVLYAAAYLRISTEEQSTFSIDTQREYCQREAKARGYELPKENIFIDDGYSAKTINRPGLIRVLELSKQKKSKICAVIVYKIDRLSRETIDYLGLRKVLGDSGVKIISCTEPTDDSPGGEFIETILAAAAKYDNAVKSVRIKDNIIQRIKSGLPHGKAKIGYLNSVLPDGIKTWVKDPEAFDKIKQAWMEMEKGTHTLDSIAKYLNSWGVMTKIKNKRYKLTKQQVSRIFTDKTYCGYAISKRNNLEVKSDKIPQMIMEDTFYRVRSILIHRNKVPSIYQRLRPEFPARGFILCDKCLSPLRAGFSKGRTKYYGYYFCQNHSTPCMSADDIDEALVRLLRELTPDDLLRKLFLEDIKRKWNDKYMEYVKQQTRVEEDIATLKELQHQIVKKNAEGLYPDKFTKEQIDKTELEIETKKTILSESKLAQIDIEVDIAFMNGFLEDLRKAYMQEKSLELKIFFLGSKYHEKLVFRNGSLEPLSLSPCFKLIRSLITHEISLSAGKRT